MTFIPGHSSEVSRVLWGGLQLAIGKSLAHAIRDNESDIFYNLMLAVHGEEKFLDINVPVYDYDQGIRYEGDSLLRIAFEEKQLDMAMMMLSSGADVDQITDLGRTPFGEIILTEQLDEVLLIATWLGKHKLAERLISAGANPDAADQERRLDMKGYDFDKVIPVVVAAAMGDTKMLDVLTVWGKADIHGTDHTGKNALHYSAMRDEATVVGKLLYLKVDPNSRDAIGFTPLHYTAKFNRVRALNVLLKNEDINPNSTDGATYGEGNTPIITAAEHNSVDVIKPLVDGGADPNAKNLRGETAFLVNVQSVTVAALEALATNGADVHATDKDGNNAFHLATQTRRGMVRLAVGSEDTRTVFERLSALGTDVNAKNNTGQTPLDIALAAQAAKPDVPTNIPEGLRTVGGKTSAELEN